MKDPCKCEESYEYHDMVNCIPSAPDARDPYTGNHSERVSDMACLLLGYLGFSARLTQMIHIAAHLHDIGKIGIPDAVLLKPERLTDEDWAVMETHPGIGRDILSKSSHFEEISGIILHHHERYNGKGYPSGTKGEEIPLGTRIIAVFDSIDAMASRRAYRDALPLEVCREEIAKNSGLMYDPDIARAALDHWAEMTAEYHR